MWDGKPLRIESPGTAGGGSLAFLEGERKLLWFPPPAPLVVEIITCQRHIRDQGTKGSKPGSRFNKFPNASRAQDNVLPSWKTFPKIWT